MMQGRPPCGVIKRAKRDPRKNHTTGKGMPKKDEGGLRMEDGEQQQ